MDELTKDELAKRSGKPADYVARLVDLEIIAPRSEGAFRPTDIQRVRLIDALDGRGSVFVDLVGYTRLTEERGDEAAAELAASLAGLVQGESRRRGGRMVKWLGDGVMIHFPDPGQAVLFSLDMVEKAPAAGMPPAHIGVSAGPLVFRDGDYFGRTVNLASRIAGKAGAGEVLVSETVRDAVSVDGARFEPMEPIELKGMAGPVKLFRAVRTS